MTARSSPSDANRLGLDYAQEAARLGTPPVPMIDVHTHLRDRNAVDCYRQVAEQFGIVETWSMTPLEQLDEVRDVLGDSVRFIAVPQYGSDDPVHALGTGFVERIDAFHERGASIVKLWCAPRSIDIGIECGRPDLASLESEERRAAMTRATELGMSIMVHVADPDTWFATHYADVGRYGTKADHYVPLRRSLEDFPVPWIAAHMGGWPERLDVLDALLAAHENLHLDTSATKWMIRALSRQDRSEVADFFRRWSGRLLFGSDIVVRDEHLKDDTAAAVELYSSRYWALRTMFETTYDGESPIDDPDLDLGIPGVTGPPGIRGLSLDPVVLRSLYRDAASAFTGRRQSAR